MTLECLIAQRLSHVSLCHHLSESLTLLGLLSLLAIWQTLLHFYLKEPFSFSLSFSFSQLQTGYTSSGFRHSSLNWTEPNSILLSEMVLKRHQINECFQLPIQLLIQEWRQGWEKEATNEWLASFETHISVRGVTGSDCYILFGQQNTIWLMVVQSRQICWEEISRFVWTNQQREKFSIVSFHYIVVLFYFISFHFGVSLCHLILLSLLSLFIDDSNCLES